MNEKVRQELDEINEDLTYFKKAIAVNGKVFNLVKETLRMQNLGQAQEIKDRKTIALLGLKQNHEMTGNASQQARASF